MGKKLFIITLLTLVHLITPTKSHEVPEWFEDCVLHWAYNTKEYWSYYTNYNDVLVDRQPFTSKRCVESKFNNTTCVNDERVNRCWQAEALQLAYPNRVEPGYGDLSPLLLKSIKNLVEKGHLRPFSTYELKNRYKHIGMGCCNATYIGIWSSDSGKIHDHFDKFRTSISEGCRRQVGRCKDYSCDQHSLEYWCQFFEAIAFQYCKVLPPVHDEF